jgi:hypothetical protein
MESLYVCEFSNGHIKVGRSINPDARIAAHADRVACVGIELVEHRTFECVGPSEPREHHLISCCAGIATARHGGEWFAGLDFDAVCHWAARFANLDDQDCIKPAPKEDVALISQLGGPAAVADLLGWDRDGGAQRVTNWLNRKTGIPASVKLEFPGVFLRHLWQPA